MHKKLIAIVLLLALTFSFAACAAANQPITNAEDVENLKKEVAGAWAKKNKYDKIEFRTFRYYGTDNGYHIIFFVPNGADLADMINGKIGEYRFMHNSGSQLMAYRNGRFIKLSIAYHLHLVSDEAIAKAAELHNQAHISQEPEPTKPLPPKEAYISQYGPVEIFREYLTIYKYGKITIIYAVRQDAPASESLKTIAGFDFKFQRESTLCAYKSGKFIDLEEAYKSGLVSKEYIERVAQKHARYESDTPS